MDLELLRKSQAQFVAAQNAQPVGALQVPIQSQNMSYLALVVAPSYEPPVLQNPDGSFVAQPLYDR